MSNNVYKKKKSNQFLKYTGLHRDILAVATFEALTEFFIKNMSWKPSNIGKTLAYFEEPDCKLFLNIENDIVIKFNDSKDIFGNSK